VSSYAQEAETPEIDRLLSSEFVVGLNLNTRGWGFDFEYGRQKTVKYTTTYGLMVTNIRAQKEHKLIGTNGSRGYYFGKLNSLIGFRLGYGSNVKLYKSLRENGIGVEFKWKVGPSFGLVKPVYLEIDKPVNGAFRQVSQRYDPSIHFPGTINSRSSWFKGLGDASFKLGVFAKSGFDFNFSQMKSGISGGSVGVMLDYYPLNNVEILYKETGLDLFMSLYLQFNLGKKF
jgi:hypothetical protein